MGLEEFLFKVRRRESFFYSKLKDILLFIIHFNVPSPKFIFRPVWGLLVFWRFSSQLIFEKLFYVPIFKARCERCGTGLSVQNSIPWVEGHLKIRIGNNVVLDANVLTSGRVEESPTLTIGDGTYVGHKVAINVGKSVTIGNKCLIAPGCLITDNDAHPINPNRRLNNETVTADAIKQIVIEDNVWIGTRAIILKGVTIGTGAIVGAQAVVTRNVPPNSIVMGNPSKVAIQGINRIAGR